MWVCLQVLSHSTLICLTYCAHHKIYFHVADPALSNNQFNFACAAVDCLHCRRLPPKWSLERCHSVLTWQALVQWRTVLPSASSSLFLPLYILLLLRAYPDQQYWIRTHTSAANNCLEWQLVHWHTHLNVLMAIFQFWLRVLASERWCKKTFSSVVDRTRLETDWYFLTGISAR